MASYSAVSPVRLERADGPPNPLVVGGEVLRDRGVVENATRPSRVPGCIACAKLSAAALARSMFLGPGPVLGSSMLPLVSTARITAIFPRLPFCSCSGVAPLILTCCPLMRGAEVVLVQRLARSPGRPGHGDRDFQPSRRRLAAPVLDLQRILPLRGGRDRQA